MLLSFKGKHHKGLLLTLYMAVTVVLYTACSTISDPIDISLSDSLAKPSTIRLPYEVSENGLIVVDAVLPNLGAEKFIVDTGATRSGIFQEIWDKNNNIGKLSSSVRVHGISKTELRHSIDISYLKLGVQELENQRLIIIKKPIHDELVIRKAIGVIGLDVLANFNIFLDREKQILFLIEPHAGLIHMDDTWKKVELTETPFDIKAYGLHFLDIKVSGVPSYALFDTGAEHNVMNWNFKHLWQLTLKRRSLRNEWEHNGALGSFEPKGLATLESISADNYVWPKHTFSVFDFKTFEVIGLKDKPLMIAGTPFFKDHGMLIDFQNDTLWIMPNYQSSTRKVSN